MISVWANRCSELCSSGLTVIRPIVTYASETGTPNEYDKNRLHTFQKQFLCKIFGPRQTGENTWRI
jgi:hypothetical protein